MDNINKVHEYLNYDKHLKNVKKKCNKLYLK